MLLLASVHASAQGVNLTGYWQDYGKKHTLRLIQSGTSVTLDFGAFAVSGALNGTSIDVPHKLTEEQAKKVASAAGSPADVEKEFQAIIKNDVFHNVYVSNGGGTLHLDFEDWKAEKRSDRIVLTHTREKIALTRAMLCCSCVDSLELVFEGDASRESSKTTQPERDPDTGDWFMGEHTLAAMIGHHFKAVIHYHNQKITDASREEPGDCQLHWMEKSDNPPSHDVKNAKVVANQWNDIGALYAKYDPDSPLFKVGSQSHWETRAKSAKACPLSSTLVELDDKPAVLLGHSRTIFFHVVVDSAPRCNCDHKSKEAWATQVLAKDQAHSGFYLGVREGDKDPKKARPKQTWTSPR
jgi:hypothetical protein